MNIWCTYIEQATDYYPYGMPMATSTGAEVNRYKYSGKELETRNGLNFYDFAARLHFPAINFMNQPDVNAADYNWLNPYLYCAANPINIIDPTGQVLQICDSNGEVYTVQIEENTLALYNAKNERVTPDDLQDTRLPDVVTNLSDLILSTIGMEIVSEVIDSDMVVTLKYAQKDNGFLEDGTIKYDPHDDRIGIGYQNASYVTRGSPTVNLCHEVAHAYDWVKGTLDGTTWSILDNAKAVYKSELFACSIENEYRRERGLPQRISYSRHEYESRGISISTPDMKTLLPVNILFFLNNINK